MINEKAWLKMRDMIAPVQWGMVKDAIETYEAAKSEQPVSGEPQFISRMFTGFPVETKDQPDEATYSEREKTIHMAAYTKGAADGLAKCPKRESGGWNDMNSFPQDGTEFLVRRKDTVVSFDKNNGCLYTQEGIHCWDADEWMPITEIEGQS